MTTKEVKMIANKRKNEFNEILPTIYIVYENNIAIIQTLDFTEALQAFLNRVK